MAKKYPDFAEKFLGKELFVKLDKLVSFSREIDDLRQEFSETDWIAMISALNICKEFNPDVQEITAGFISFIRQKVQKPGSRCYNRPDRAFQGVREIVRSQHIDDELSFMNFLLGELSRHCFLQLLYITVEEEKNAKEYILSSDLLNEDIGYYFYLSEYIQSLESLFSAYSPNQCEFYREFGDVLARELELLSIYQPLQKEERRFSDMPSEIPLYLVTGNPRFLTVSNVVDLSYVFIYEGEKSEEINFFTDIEAKPGALNLFLITDNGCSIRLLRHGILGGFHSSFLSLDKILPKSDFYYYLRMRILMELHLSYDLAIKEAGKNICLKKGEECNEVSIFKYVPWELREKEGKDFCQKLEEIDREAREVKQKLQLPVMTSREVINVLLKKGCKELRQNGSHVILQSPNGAKYSIPHKPGRVLGIGMVLNLLKTLGFSRNEFLAEL